MEVAGREHGHGWKWAAKRYHDEMPRVQSAVKPIDSMVGTIIMESAAIACGICLKKAWL